MCTPALELLRLRLPPAFPRYGSQQTTPLSLGQRYCLAGTALTTPLARPSFFCGRRARPERLDSGEGKSQGGAEVRSKRSPGPPTSLSSPPGSGARPAPRLPAFMPLFPLPESGSDGREIRSTDADAETDLDPCCLPAFCLGVTCACDGRDTAVASAVPRDDAALSSSHTFTNDQRNTHPLAVSALRRGCGAWNAPPSSLALIV